MSEVVISRFAEGDMQGVIDVILPIQREEFEIPITAADQPDLRDIPGFYQVGHGDFWVAKVGGRVVGTIGLKDIGEGQAALRKMFVAEAWRGREFGVAAALLQGLLAAAKGRGIREVYLGTTTKFLAAHRFYEKNGFVEIGLDALPERFPRMAVDTKFYRIALG
ncbi:GNAT family N-acetyltransferase [Rhizobium sp. ACO-34A]|nr:GNAT family N-acetyltransferase [Rhizobium sp. ACO-34A]ATN34036.1 GNAT family N-acetyltransferase [Rhizobium sp. ACO-34A]